MKNNTSRFLAALLAVLVGIDTAAACRWLRSCGWCEPVAPPACEVSCPTGCSSSWQVVETPVAESSCGGCSDCGSSTPVETVVETHASGSSSRHTPTLAPVPAAPPEPTTIAEPAPAAFGASGFRSDAPAPVEESPAPTEDWDAGLEQTPPSPTVVESEPAQEQPPEELFAPVAAEEPIAETEEPADDLFGAEPEAADDVAAPSDDLFGEPAEAPAEEEPAEEDLFGEPAADEPADDLFGEPAEEPAADEPADDLFGGDAAEEEPAGDDLFGEPAEEPAADEPADDLFGSEPVEEESAGDDLFGEPAEEPAADEPADDLFGEPAADESADDLFGEPADEDAGDLFGEPAEDEPAGEEDDADDLFGIGATLRESGGLYSVKDRTWVDNTGRFSMVGRLLALDGGEVRLVKQDGAVATVPLSRLSQGDLEFVSRQSLAQSQIREWAIAHGKSPVEGLRTAQR